MAVTGIYVEGLREKVKALESFGVDVSELKAAFGEISTWGADVVRGLTPRQSGALAGTARGSRAKASATVTVGRSSVPYAGPILWGWPDRGIEPASTITLADKVFESEAPDRFESGIGALIRKHGLT